MRRSNYLIGFICSIILLLTSCSKDDPASTIEEETTAHLSFGAVLNDLMKDNLGKQLATDLPACSDEAPSYVAVVLTGTAAIGSMEDPLIVPINPTPGDYDNDGEDEFFTMETPDLELEPGIYSLDFFAVYDSADNLIWLAPMDGGVLADRVNALPMEFQLDPGVKKYLDVDVLCYDNRFLNLYGYAFFRFEGTQIIEFCLFGNVCDANGRHAPANFRFDVWTYSGNPADPYGVPLFDENAPHINTININEDGDPYSDPLCIFLPATEGEDIYYAEIYLIENDNRTMIRSGQFTDADVQDFYSGTDNLDYYHFREGCGQQDSSNIFGQGGDPVEIATLADYVIHNRDYSTFEAALEMTGLMPLLEDTNEHTLFLPNNDAFDHYLGINGYSSLNEFPGEILTQLVLNHLQPGRLNAENFTTGYIESMAKAPELDEILSMFINTSGKIEINGEVNVLNADIELENGIIHAVDYVIDLPTLWTFLTADPNLSHHRDAYAAEWQDLNVPRLREDGSLTLLAATNGGWERAFESARISGVEDLTYSFRELVLDTHRLLYPNLRSGDFWEGEVKTANDNGWNVTFSLGDPITVTDYVDQTFEFVELDIQAKNGVLHIINGVLLLY